MQIVLQLQSHIIGNEKSVIFPHIKIPKVSQMEHELPGMLLGAMQKSLCGEINLENTKLTEITSVVCFFPLQDI